MAAINRRNNFKVNWYNPSLERLRNQTDKIVRQNIQKRKQQTSMMSLLDPFFNIKAQKRIGASNWFEGVFKGLYGKNGVFDNFLGEWFRNPGQALVNDLQIIGNTLDYGANLIKAPLIASVKGESVSTRLKDAYGLGDRGRVEQNMSEFRKALGCPASGTISGVLAGTMIGTQIAPGWGTLIGAAVGVTVGGVSDILRANNIRVGDTITDMAMEYSADPGNIAGTIAAPIKAIGTAKKAIDVADTAQETLEQTVKHIDDMNNVVKTNTENLKGLREQRKTLSDKFKEVRTKAFDDYNTKAADIKSTYEKAEQELKDKAEKYNEYYGKLYKKVKGDKLEKLENLHKKYMDNYRIEKRKLQNIRDAYNKTNVDEYLDTVKNACVDLDDVVSQIKTAEGNIADVQKSTREFFEQSKQRIIDYAQGKSVNISAEDAHDWLIQGTAEFSIDQASKFKSTANIAARRQKFFDNYRKRIYNAIYDGDKKEFSKLFMQAGLHKLDEGTSLTVKQMDNMFNVLVKDMNVSKAYKVFHWFDSFDQSLAKGLFKITPMGMAAKAVKKGIALNKKFIRSKVLADTYSKLNTEMFDTKKANEAITETNKKVSEINKGVAESNKAKFKKASKAYQEAKELYQKDYDAFMENVKKHNPTEYDNFKAKFKEDYGFDYIPKKEITSENRGKYVSDIKKAIEEKEIDLENYYKTLDTSKPFSEETIANIESKQSKINQLKGTLNNINLGDENHFISYNSLKSKIKNIVRHYYKVDDKNLETLMKSDVFKACSDEIALLLRDPENYELLDRIIFELQYIATKDGYKTNDYINVLLDAMFEQSKKYVSESADETYLKYLTEFTDKIKKSTQTSADAIAKFENETAEVINLSNDLAKAKMEDMTDEAYNYFRQKYVLFRSAMSVKNFTHKDYKEFIDLLEPAPIDPALDLDIQLELIDKFNNLKMLHDQLETSYKAIKTASADRYFSLRQYETLLQDGRDAVRKYNEAQALARVFTQTDESIQDLMNTSDEIIAQTNVMLQEKLFKEMTDNDAYKQGFTLGENFFSFTNEKGEVVHLLDMISNTNLIPTNSVFAKIYNTANWLGYVADMNKTGKSGLPLYIENAFLALEHQIATVAEYDKETLKTYSDVIENAIKQLEMSNFKKDIDKIFQGNDILSKDKGLQKRINYLIKMYALSQDAKYVNKLEELLNSKLINKDLSKQDSVVEAIISAAHSAKLLIFFGAGKSGDVYTSIGKFIERASDAYFVDRVNITAFNTYDDILDNLKILEKRLDNIKNNKLQQSIIINDACKRSIDSAKDMIGDARKHEQLSEELQDAEILINQLDDTRKAYQELNIKIEQAFKKHYDYEYNQELLKEIAEEIKDFKDENLYDVPKELRAYIDIDITKINGENLKKLKIKNEYDKFRKEQFSYIFKHQPEIQEAVNKFKDTYYKYDRELAILNDIAYVSTDSNIELEPALQKMINNFSTIDKKMIDEGLTSEQMAKYKWTMLSGFSEAVRINIEKNLDPKYISKMASDMSGAQDPEYYYMVRSLFKRLAQVEASLKLLDTFRTKLGLKALIEGDKGADAAINSALAHIKSYAKEVHARFSIISNPNKATNKSTSKSILNELLEIDASKRHFTLSELESVSDDVIEKPFTQLSKKDELENMLYAITAGYKNEASKYFMINNNKSIIKSSDVLSSLWGDNVILAPTDVRFTDLNFPIAKDGYGFSYEALDDIVSRKHTYAVTTMDANGNIIKDDPELLDIIKDLELRNTITADIETTITNDDNKNIVQLAAKSNGKKLNLFVYNPDYSPKSKKGELLDEKYVNGSMLENPEIIEHLASNNAESYAVQSDGSLLFKDEDSMARYLLKNLEENGNIINIDGKGKFIIISGHNNTKFDDDYILKALKKIDPSITGIAGIDNLAITRKLKAFGLVLQHEKVDFNSLDNIGKLAYCLANMRVLKQENIYNELINKDMIKAIEGIAHNASTDIEYTEAIFNLLKNNNIKTISELDDFINSGYKNYNKVLEIDPALHNLEINNFTDDLTKDVINDIDSLKEAYGILNDTRHKLKLLITGYEDDAGNFIEPADRTSYKYLKAYEDYVDALSNYNSRIQSLIKNDKKGNYTEDMFAEINMYKKSGINIPDEEFTYYIENSAKMPFDRVTVYRRYNVLIQYKDNKEVGMIHLTPREAGSKTSILDFLVKDKHSISDILEQAKENLNYLKNLKNHIMYGIYGDSCVIQTVNNHYVNHALLQRFNDLISDPTDNTFNTLRGIFEGVITEDNLVPNDIAKFFLDYISTGTKELDYEIYNKLVRFYKHTDRIKAYLDFYSKLDNMFSEAVVKKGTVDPEFKKAYSTILESLFSNNENVGSFNNYLGKFYHKNRAKFNNFDDFLKEIKKYNAMLNIKNPANLEEALRIFAGDDEACKKLKDTIYNYITDCIEHSDEVIYDSNYFAILNPQLNRTSLNIYHRAVSDMFDRYDRAYAGVDTTKLKIDGEKATTDIQTAKNQFAEHMNHLRSMLSIKKNTLENGLILPEGYLSEMYGMSLFDINSSMTMSSFKRMPKGEKQIQAAGLIKDYRDMLGVKFDIFNDSPAITYRNQTSIAEDFVMDMLDEKTGIKLLPSDITAIFNELNVIKKPYMKSLIEALALNYDELADKISETRHFQLYKNFVEEVANRNIDYTEVAKKAVDATYDQEAIDQVFLMQKQAKAIAVMMYYMDEYDDDIYMTLKRGELRQSYEATKKFLNKEYSNTLEPPVRPKWEDFEPKDIEEYSDYLDYVDTPDIKNMVDYTSNTLLINNQHWLSTFGYKDAMGNNKVNYEAMYRYLQSNDDLELIVMHKSKKYRQGGASTYLKDLKSNNKYDRTAGEINIINAKSSKDLENLFNLNRDDIIVSILDKNTIQKYRKTIGHLGRNRVYKSNTLNKLVVLRDAIMHYICLPIKLMGLENIGFTVTNALEGMTKTLIGTSGDRASTMKQYGRATTMHKNWQNTMLEFEQMSGVRTAGGVLMASPLYKRVKDPRKLIEYDTVFGNAVKNLGEDFANDDTFKTLPKYIQSIYKNSMELHKTKPEKYDYSFAEYIEGIKTRVDQISKITTDKKSKMYQILNDDSFYDEFNYVNRFINSPAASAEYQSLMRADDMGAIENSTKSKGIDKLYNRVFFTEWAPVISPAFNMGLNSDIETINRLALDLDLFEKGFTESETLNRVLKTHFNYSNKSQLELTADMMFPFISFPLRTFMFWADALEENPELIKVFADLMLCNWKGQENNPYNQGKISKGGIWLWGDVAMESGLSVYSSMSFIGNPIDALYNKKLNPLAGYAIEGIKSLALGKKSDKYDYRLGRLPGVSHTKAGINLANSLAKGEVHPYTVAPSLFNRVYQNNGYYYRNQGRYVYKNIYNNIFYAHGKQRSVNNQIKRGWK